MGWCSGTDVFDGMAKTILEDSMDDEMQEFLIARLIRVLWDSDWDCESDSDYFNHPVVRRAFHRLEPIIYPLPKTVILRDGQPVAEFDPKFASLARMAVLMFAENEAANGNSQHVWTVEGD